MPTKMPVKAAPMIAPTWTGSYVGINGGWGWAQSSHTDSVTGLTTGDFSQNGGLVGVTFGTNWQSGQWVFGFESDFDFADINGSFTSATLCGVSGGNTCYTKLNDLGTDRLRAGFDVNGWLLFATGGLAYGQVDTGQTPCIGTVAGASCNKKWRAGWVAGGGVEKMFAPNWSIKAEYLHFDLGRRAQYTPTVDVNVLERGDLVRVGVN